MASKKKVKAHVIDDKGKALFKASLPEEWTTREFTPDYGIDFNVELFSEFKANDKSVETLGEHVFIQLKSKDAPVIQSVPIYERNNVSLTRSEELNQSKSVGTIDAYKIQLEMSELETVRKMGPGMPVLLFVADIKKEKCSFVCLNDYIDKILIPQHDDFTSSASRTIIVPVSNDMGTSRGQSVFRWYAKRSKLYAAFPVFHYQKHMLRSRRQYKTFHYTAQLFLDRIRHYDFWEDNAGWDILRYFPDNFPNIQKSLTEIEIPLHYEFSTEYSEFERFVRSFWDQLDRIALQYEETCREWFLPTALGVLSSGVK